MNHEVKKGVRELVPQVAEEIGVNILNGVVSSDHVQHFCRDSSAHTGERVRKESQGSVVGSDTTRISSAKEDLLG